MTVEAFPLSWPAGVPRTPAHERERARFGRGERVGTGESTWRTIRDLTLADARERLLGELRRLDAGGVVLSTNVGLRLDGLPRSGRRTPDDPGVAVYFTLEGVPHCLPCDQWDRVEDNIAAVAKHIEATRGQLRWGVGDVRAAFAGFRALPAKGGTTVGADGAPWWQVLGVQPDASAEVVDVAFRVLARQAHPDSGGSDGAMAALNRAREQARAGRA